MKITTRRHDFRTRHEKQEYYLQRWLQFWAYAQVTDQKTIVLATKRGSVLQSVQVIDAATDSMVDVMKRDWQQESTDSGDLWTPGPAFDFLYRLLVFVHELLTSPRTLKGRVVELTFEQDQSSVILPKFLSLSESEEMRKTTE